VRSGGALGRENVGISNHNASERLAHRKPKVSLAMFINQGLVGPKDKQRCDAEGQPVNIPAPLLILMGRRSFVVRVIYWIIILDLRMLVRQIRQALNPRAEKRLGLLSRSG